MTNEQQIALLRESLEKEQAVRIALESALAEKNKELSATQQQITRLQSSSHNSTGTPADQQDCNAANKQLAEQRQFYEDVLNQLPGDVAVMNPDRTFLFLNPQAVSDKALREWLIGKKDEDYCQARHKPMDLALRRKAIVEEVLRSKQLRSWEEEFVLPDGRVEYQQRNIYPVMDQQGNIKMLIGYGANITELKKIEQKIQRSEKRYHDLFTFSQALICTHDATGTLLSINPALYQLMGYTAEEMTGKKIYEFLPEEDRAKFVNRYLSDILKNGKDEGVFRVRCKNGQLLFLLYQNYKMEEAGTDTYIIGFAQNITSRIEEERELRTAKQLTEEAARAKEIFLANMSHEIRTPMNGVLGMAGLLAKTNLDRQQMKYLELIQESANNLLKIVNDVLDLEKTIMGKLQFEEVSFSLARRVAMCVQSFIFKADEKDIVLTYNNNLPEDLVVVGDPHRLNQVLNNLISNALKFTDTGSVTVQTHIVKEKKEQISICFSVQDTGIGIPQDKLNDVFEPFTQAHSSVSRKYGGTGLGLSICREMIQLMGGELQVKSNENEGSVFSFILPFKTSTENPEQLPHVQDINQRKHLGRRKILLAEDVELNQYLAKHIMESWGLEVTVAGNGRDAVEQVKQHDFDLVLMDIQMPEMDGIEATKHIRKLSDTRKATIPIVALTANALKGDSEKYLAVGMNGYVSKPFDESKLYTMISRNLNDQSQAVQTNTAASQQLLYDLKELQAISGGDQAFIKRMVGMFIDTMPASLNEMQQLVQQQNWPALGKLAHRLKPTIDTMGIISLKDDIRTIETNGNKKALSDNEIDTLVQKLDTVVSQCIEQLKKEFSLN
ncbi:MAG: ATP-binding protein [Chitinophagaceae bacterium]